MALRASRSLIHVYGERMEKKKAMPRNGKKKGKKMWVQRREEKKETSDINTSALCTWRSDKWEKMSQRLKKKKRRDGKSELLGVLGPSAYQFPCSWQRIGSLTTVGQRRLLSQSYSVLDGFNLEQLVDDEPIHMVFKSLSVFSTINLQHSLDLCYALTDSPG